MLRNLIGLAMGFLGGWMLWSVGGAVFREIGNGLSLMEALQYPPTAIRVIASLAAFCAGLATLVYKQNMGLWLAGVATFMFGLLVAGLIAAGTDVSMWGRNLVYLSCLTALFLGLFVTRVRGTTNE